MLNLEIKREVLFELVKLAVKKTFLFEPILGKLVKGTKCRIIKK